MSDPGYSSTEADFYDLHLRELTMQGFFTRLQTGDRRVIKLALQMKVTNLTIWEEGDPIDNVMMMEQFINDKVLSDNQQRRARNRRSQSPILHGRAASITVMIVYISIIY
uniref:PDEase domain-containing protein n=1 Tax=Meloidogyne hapla TaxID=6305 RepID=A0A1I8BCA1_MELHA